MSNSVRLPLLTNYDNMSPENKQGKKMLGAEARTQETRTTTSVQLKMSNPQHSSGCGLRRAVGVWLYSIWIELKDLQ